MQNSLTENENPSLAGAAPSTGEMAETASMSSSLLRNRIAIALGAVAAVGATTTIALAVLNSGMDLSSLRNEESQALTESGFKNDYFTALENTSNIIDSNIESLPMYESPKANPLDSSEDYHNYYINKISYDDFNAMLLRNEYGDIAAEAADYEEKIKEFGSVNIGGDYSCSSTNIKNFLVDFTEHSDPMDRMGSSEDQQATFAVERAARLQNTLFLQALINCAPDNSNLVLPTGTFYFSIGSVINPGNYGYTYAIKPRDTISVSGSGIGDYREKLNDALNDKMNVGNVDTLANIQVVGESATILKTFTEAGYPYMDAPDMFYYNDYRESGFTSPTFLRNVHHENFIIDGAYAFGKCYYSGEVNNCYGSAGKGFMYNLFENITWDHVVVKNTSGTGFGVDLPHGESYINYSIALFNGKAAMLHPDENNKPDYGYPGASGFGIGTGYSNEESFSIENSVAYGNAKFGYFYEHQNRFYNPCEADCQYPYEATEGENGNGNIQASSEAFKVVNSISAKNLYNYGGMRAYDILVNNCVAISGSVYVDQIGEAYDKTTTTLRDVFYSDDTRRVNIPDGAIAAYSASGSGDFSDVSPSRWSYPYIKWAVQQGITNGTNASLSNTEASTFEPGNSIKRQEAITLIWRMMGYSGYTVTRANDNQDSGRKHKEFTCFSDVPSDSYYAPAVRWAYEIRPQLNGVSVMSKTCDDGTFNGEEALTRLEAVYMLWRLAADEPAVDDSCPTMFYDNSYCTEEPNESNGLIKVPHYSELKSDYFKAINWAYSKGATDYDGTYTRLLEGYCEDKNTTGSCNDDTPQESRQYALKPANNITREEFSKLLYIFYEYYQQNDRWDAFRGAN